MGKILLIIFLVLYLNCILYKIFSIYWKVIVNSNYKVIYYKSFKNIKSNVLYLGDNMFKFWNWILGFNFNVKNN